MKTQFNLLALLLFISAGGAALAHGKDGVHLKGTLKEVTAESLTVRTTDENDVVVALNPRTKFSRGETTATAAELITGEKVVVHARKSKDGTLLAEVVKLAKRGATTPAPKPAPNKEGSHDHANH